MIINEKLHKYLYYNFWLPLFLQTVIITLVITTLFSSDFLPFFGPSCRLDFLA